ncbi:hypothetical protein JTE90_023779 [Oedothorax gibbosus]|uniref:Uncharacterized protein n=1 Tax=Oedothorax gibbosus TaxID=931172 RepID=A0AAV6UTH7_9ARAC|nr:hypothetical protein JTE90_023779 [Oedothorax gibbosus]
MNSYSPKKKAHHMFLTPCSSSCSSFLEHYPKPTPTSDHWVFGLWDVFIFLGAEGMLYLVGIPCLKKDQCWNLPPSSWSLPAGKTNTELWLLPERLYCGVCSFKKAFARCFCLLKTF